MQNETQIQDPSDVKADLSYNPDVSSVPINKQIEEDAKIRRSEANAEKKRQEVLAMSPEERSKHDAAEALKYAAAYAAMKDRFPGIQE
jgi:hypothetical protein